jgi:hypothetical protein
MIAASQLAERRRLADMRETKSWRRVPPGRVTEAMRAGALLLLICDLPPLAAASSALLAVASGPCELSHNGTCVTDGPGNYGNFERCSMRAETAVSVSASAFDVESRWDYITIGSTRYSGASGPSGVVMATGETFTWYSDGLGTRSGFVICASPAPPPAPPAPPAPPLSPPLPPSSPALLTVAAGASYCEVTNGGACVTDGSGDYGNNERCSMRAETAVILSSSAFDVQSIGTTLPSAARRAATSRHAAPRGAECGRE